MLRRKFAGAALWPRAPKSELRSEEQVRPRFFGLDAMVCESVVTLKRPESREEVTLLDGFLRSGSIVFDHRLGRRAVPLAEQPVQGPANILFARLSEYPRHHLTVLIDNQRCRQFVSQSSLLEHA